jgi:hypothetical protein
MEFTKLICHKDDEFPVGQCEDRLRKCVLHELALTLGRLCKHPAAVLKSISLREPSSLVRFFLTRGIRAFLHNISYERVEKGSYF